MDKNTFARIFLFVLLIAVGLFWGFAAAGDDYGPLEGTWYPLLLAFFLALNVLNYIKDKKRGHL